MSRKEYAGRPITPKRNPVCACIINPRETSFSEKKLLDKLRAINVI
jgi:hypothetical protein